MKLTAEISIGGGKCFFETILELEFDHRAAPDFYKRQLF